MNKIQYKTDNGYEKEMNEYDAYTIIRCFVREVQQDLLKEHKKHSKKRNNYAQVSSNPLLDESEIRRLIHKNKKEHGKTKMTEKIAKQLRHKVETFIQKRKKEDDKK